MSLTRTTADAALKEFYLPAVREQLNNKNKFLAQVSQAGQEEIEGRRAVLSLHLSRNNSVGARVEGAYLPGTNSGGSTAIGNQGYGEERVPLKYNYGRLQLSGPVMRAMGSDRGSFIRALDSEMKGLTNDAKRDQSRQIWNDGSGKIIQLATDSGTVIDFATTATAVQRRQLEAGMKVDIGTVTDSTVIYEGNEVVSVSATAVTLLNAIGTVGATHFIYRSGINPGGAAAGIELTGMQSIVDSTGALFNLNPATAGQSAWSSTELGNSGTNRAISDDLLAQLMDATEIASGLENDEGQYQLWMSDGVRRAYAATMTAQKRFVNSIDLKGGFKGLESTAGGGSVPVAWERDVPSNTVFYVNTKHIKWFKKGDWSWMDEDGAILSRRPNVEAYEATLHCDAELTTDRRNAHGKLADISE